MLRRILFLMLLMISSSAAMSRPHPSYFGNVLRTGEEFSDGHLGYFGEHASLYMNRDCDLVFRNENGVPVRHSNTADKGFTDCTLSFTAHGRLQIKAPDGTQLWKSTNKSPRGDFAAVIPANVQKASIYGPMIWSFGKSSPNQPSFPTGVGRNLMFSGTVMQERDKVYDSEKTLELVDCELVLKDNKNENVEFRTYTAGNGQNCIAMLSHHGVLSIFDNHGKIIYASEQRGELKGEYVLILQNDGKVAIYGPEVWSAEDQNSGLIPYNNLRFANQK